MFPLSLEINVLDPAQLSVVEHCLLEKSFTLVEKLPWPPSLLEKWLYPLGNPHGKSSTPLVTLLERQMWQFIPSGISVLNSSSGKISLLAPMDIWSSTGGGVPILNVIAQWQIRHRCSPTKISWLFKLVDNYVPLRLQTFLEPLLWNFTNMRIFEFYKHLQPFLLAMIVFNVLHIN